MIATRALAALQWPFRVLAAAVTDTAIPGLGRARLTADPTDLVALPALIAPVRLASRYAARRERSRWPSAIASGSGAGTD